ncbi:thioredoxin family protein [Carboxylicivirga taeanensis]|uniref:thioredoxin family protein n=1 Tax=Carboxylicivirga taeanensis TaxID=1416875 RepID=UPI003F6DD628
MIKSQIILLLFIFFGRVAFGQGIDFKNISYEEALQLAKKQDKLIFVDFYTAWCGPCKKLAKGPFLEAENGDFYNKHFICIKLDAEKEGKDAAKIHKVLSFPTLLFINSDGEVVHQGVGVTIGADMIAFGTAALNAGQSKYSWEKLNKLFPQKQKDEQFLKLYIEKMKEFDADPYPGIEAWLKVQTEMDESSREMMEFLVTNSSNIQFGGKAEAILKANYEYYLSIAPNKYQRQRLERIPQAIGSHMLKKARRAADPELMALVIEKTKEYDLSIRRGDDLTTYQLDYYLFKQDNEAYKSLAKSYVDSLIQYNPLEKVKKEDSKYFDKFGKMREGIMYTFYKEGKIANDLIDLITKVGYGYLTCIDNKKEYKTLNSWINYCYELIPGKFSVNNLKADMLYKKGKTKMAIELKKSAIEKMPDRDKAKSGEKYKLEQWLKSINQ